MKTTDRGGFESVSARYCSKWAGAAPSLPARVGVAGFQPQQRTGEGFNQPGHPAVRAEGFPMGPHESIALVG